MGLVGLYACIVRRLEVRKRKTCKFIGFIGSFCSCGCLCCVCCFACLVCFAPVVCGLCCWWLFFPSDDCDKKKGRKGLCLASSLVLLWVALFGCRFVLCELVRTQSVSIVTKFYIKIFAAGAANFFALACVLTCIVVFPFHISCV